MAVQIPEKSKDLLAWEKKAFVILALVRSDGTPHVTPVWFDWDGTHIVINTARGRVKDKLLRKHPAVAMVVLDPANPYRYLQIRGKVAEETEQGAYEMICRLNEKYQGKHEFSQPPGQVRVTYKISPESVSGNDS